MDVGRKYFYDIEIAPDLFTVTFLPDINRKFIRAYERLSISNDYAARDILIKGMRITKFVIRRGKADDLQILYEFLSRYKILIGYNSTNYDGYILDYIYANYHLYKNGYNKNTNAHITQDLYFLSQDVIDYGAGFYNIMNTKYLSKHYKRPFKNLDIQKILYLDKKFVGLKQVAIMLNWYRIQDLPYKYDQLVVKDNNIKIEDDEVINKILDYNLNDVLITALLWYTSEEEILLREQVSDLYETDVTNQSRSGMANKLFAKFYMDNSGLSYRELSSMRTIRRYVKFGDIIDPKIEFNSFELQNILREFKATNFEVTSKLSKKFAFRGKAYTIATGGLHSIDKPNIYISTPNKIYRDCDVTSFYPSIMINRGVCPKHLNLETFIGILRMLMNKRVHAKAVAKQIKKVLHKQITEAEIVILRQSLLKYNTEAEALKIVINAIYGKTGDMNSPLCDLKSMYTTTINGQLYLLKLIEMITDLGLNIVSANTDGIITEVTKDKEQEYYRVCKEWEEMFNFNLEYTDYHKYICYAVNDYIAIKQEFVESKSERDDVKRKGMFLTELQIDKGYFAPAISKAVGDYFIYGTPIEQSLYANKNIYDFCISKKSNDSFYNSFQYIDTETKKLVEEIVQKNIRFYITEANDGTIVKKYKNPKPNKKGTVIKQISIIAKQNLKIFNDYYPDEMENYKINYKFYNNECLKIVEPIKFNSNTLFSQLDAIVETSPVGEMEDDFNE